MSIVTGTSSWQPIVDGAAEGEANRGRTKGASGHGLGAPHPRVFVRFILGLTKPTTGFGETHLTHIRDFMTKYGTPVRYTTDDDIVLRR